MHLVSSVHGSVCVMELSVLKSLFLGVIHKVWEYISQNQILWDGLLHSLKESINFVMCHFGFILCIIVNRELQFSLSRGMNIAVGCF